MSPRELLWSELCSNNTEKKQHSMTVVLPAAGAALRPCKDTELVASSADELQLLMDCVTCEHTLVVLPPFSAPNEHAEEADILHEDEPNLVQADAAYSNGHAAGHTSSSDEDDEYGAAQQGRAARKWHWRRVAAAREAAINA